MAQKSPDFHDPEAASGSPRLAAIMRARFPKPSSGQMDAMLIGRSSSGKCAPFDPAVAQKLRDAVSLVAQSNADRGAGGETPAEIFPVQVATSIAAAPKRDPE